VNPSSPLILWISQRSEDLKQINSALDAFTSANLSTSFKGMPFFNHTAYSSYIPHFQGCIGTVGVMDLSLPKSHPEQLHKAY